jgi:hypothetical protein
MSEPGPPPGAGPPAGAAPATTSWYRSTLFVGFALVFCWPLGLLLILTSRTASLAIKLIVSALYCCLGLVYVMGVLADVKKGRTRPAVVATPASKPQSVAFLRSVNDEKVECLQVNAPDPDAFKSKLDRLRNGKIEGLNVDAAGDTSSVGIDKQTGKSQTLVWKRLDVCPQEGAFGECDADLAVAYAYALGPAISLKKDCLGQKAQWKEAPLYGAALAALTASPLKLTAVYLQNAYDENEVEADKAFKDHELQVTGTVSSTSKDRKKPYVGLATSNKAIPVLAYGLSAAQAANLRPGAAVTFTCKGGGKTLKSAVLQECTQ